MMPPLPPLPVNASDFLPHQGFMCCIDTLVEEEGDHATAVVTLREGHALVTRGVLDRPGFIELAAQAAGARQGYVRLKRGLGLGPGFLVGAQDFIFKADAVTGDTLAIIVRLTGEFRGVSVVVASICRGEEELACGKLKVYEPPAQTDGSGV